MLTSPKHNYQTKNIHTGTILSTKLETLLWFCHFLVHDPIQDPNLNLIVIFPKPPKSVIVPQSFLLFHDLNFWKVLVYSFAEYPSIEGFIECFLHHIEVVHLWQDTPPKGCYVLLSTCFRRHVMLICIIPGEAPFHHLGKVGTVRVSAT